MWWQVAGLPWLKGCGRVLVGKSQNLQDYLVSFRML
jgi:hypothetical protein